MFAKVSDKAAGSGRFNVQGVSMNAQEDFIYGAIKKHLLALGFRIDDAANTCAHVLSNYKKGKTPAVDLLKSAETFAKNNYSRKRD